MYQVPILILISNNFEYTHTEYRLIDTCIFIICSQNM